MVDSEKKLCPSAPCSPDALLLGRIGSDHRVRYLGHRMNVGKGFVDAANQGATPEGRFRFADRCVESSCKQWSDGRCKVADLAIHILSDLKHEEERLPKCSIRSDCRWFSQSGAMACSVCSMVTTEGVGITRKLGS